MKLHIKIILPTLSLVMLTSCAIQTSLGNLTTIAPITSTVTSPKKLALTPTQLKRWSHLDIAKDTIPGMSVDRAYAELIKNAVGTKVIVGIVDSGVDIEHEDLKGSIWINTKEIEGNGIDDDANGYIDDINGWNFLGDIVKENMEADRIAHDRNGVDQATYEAALAESDKAKADATKNIVRYQDMMNKLVDSNELIENKLKKQDYTAEEVEAITDPELEEAKFNITQLLGFGLPIPALKVALQDEIDKTNAILSEEKQYIDYRTVLNDDANDMSTKHYGNNNVLGLDKSHTLHGTHVSGIVAQTRSNDKGGDGIANNVSIMTVRAVPDGDEYDKDVALAIRYAVDNGAKVINGSFGKGYSPKKEWVFEAIKYAESKDVLIVHAAGNSAENIDVADNFPNDSADKINELADNVLTVGALGPEYGSNMVARFSNYGKLNVDVFAPGVQIYATTPDNNYQFLQGTSMASPNVAGVAALVRSYYPKLSASQVKHIIMDSGVEIPIKVKVAGKPDDLKKLSEISVSGKIVNAYNA